MWRKLTVLQAKPAQGLCSAPQGTGIAYTLTAVDTESGNTATVLKILTCCCRLHCCSALVPEFKVSLYLVLPDERTGIYSCKGPLPWLGRFECEALHCSPPVEKGAASQQGLNRIQAGSAVMERDKHTSKGIPVRAGWKSVLWICCLALVANW